MFETINNIDQVYEAIRDRDEFRIVDKGDYIYADYNINLEDTFPQPNTKDLKLNQLYRIRREVRGIKFFKNGKIAARPYHKFFNVNERNETHLSNLNFSKSFIALEKLDGSMIHPMVINNQIVYMTKAGITDVANFAQEFCSKNGYINDFCWDMIKSGFTPIFEYCSLKQRIVVPYPKEKMVLTGVRKTVEGTYLTYDQMHAVAEPYRIEVVKTWNGKIETLQSFMDNVQSNENEEGWIVRWHDGHMVKIKNLWYCQLHKTKSAMAFEKDVWRMILSGTIDDAKGFMEKEEIEKIEDFEKKLYKEITNIAERARWIVIEAQDKYNKSKKDFAINVVNSKNNNFNATMKGLLFKIWDSELQEDQDTTVDLVEKICLDHTNSASKIEIARQFLGGGVKWEPLWDSFDDN